MFTKLCKLGRNANVGMTTNNRTYATLAVSYSVGYGQNERIQWMEATLWGDRALKLAPHLKAGTEVVLSVDDLEIQNFIKKDKTKSSKLVSRVIDIEFVGKKSQDWGTPQQPTQYTARP